MEALTQYINNIDWTLTFIVLFGVSEALAQIPQVESNSVFQIVFGLIKKLVKK